MQAEAEVEAHISTLGYHPSGRRTQRTDSSPTTASHCANIDQPVISCQAQQTLPVATMQLQFESNCPSKLFAPVPHRPRMCGA